MESSGDTRLHLSGLGHMNRPGVILEKFPWFFFDRLGRISMSVDKLYYFGLQNHERERLIKCGGCCRIRRFRINLANTTCLINTVYGIYSSEIGWKVVIYW